MEERGGGLGCVGGKVVRNGRWEKRVDIVGNWGGLISMIDHVPSDVVHCWSNNIQDNIRAMRSCIQRRGNVYEGHAGNGNV